MSRPQVVAAASTSNTSVTVEFDQNVLADAVLRNLSSYFIDGGLFVEGVTVTSATVVTLTTSKQVGSREYKVSVSAGVRSTPGLEYLDPAFSSAKFSGTSADAEFVVSGLEARTWPGGEQIDLFWTNPASPTVTHTKIVRRQKNPPLNDTDSGTVVYNSTAITGADTEPKYSDSGLVPGVFYYYLVMVKHASSTAWDVNDNSRVMGLSGDTALGSKAFLKKRVPRPYIELDEKPPQTGLLDKILGVLGGGVDVVRSWVNAIRTSIDDEQKPYHLVKHEVRGMGFEPEGEQYDFEVPRRLLLSLTELWSKRGTNPGVVLAVDVLTKWTASLIEFGLEGRARVFGTWDDAVAQDGGTVAAGAGVAFSLTDAGAAWTTNEWADGRVLDSMGNFLDVLSNTATVLTFKPLSATGTVYRTLLTAGAIVGATSVVVTSTVGLLVGQRVQLYDSSTGNSQVVEITAIVPSTGTVHFWNPLLVAMTTTATLGWEIIKPEAFMRGSVPGGEPAGEITVTVPTGVMRWLYGQWIGYSFKDSGGAVHVITGSDATKIYYDAAEGVIPVGNVDIAFTFSAGTPEQRYEVFGDGHRPTMFNPRFDWELRGTRLDPFYYFASGVLPLFGNFGPCDLGVYITTANVCDVLSRPSGVSGSVLTDASANFTVNALAGKYLNPNQNQTRMLKIVSNTATTITVAEDIENTAVVGIPYYVMSERNKNRFQRLSVRLQEFVASGVKARVLFL